MDKFPSLPAWFFATLAALVVSMPAAVKLLLFLMTLDFLTGLIAAAMEKKLSSDVGRIGLGKKSLVLIIVAAVHLVAHYSGIGFDLGSLVAMAYAVNEMVSITENSARAGVPIPPQLLEFLEKAKKLGQWDGKIDRRIESNSVKIPSPGIERRIGGKP